MKPISFVLCLALISAAVLAGCSRERSSDSDSGRSSNLIRDYVETPLDRAEDIKDQLEERNRRMLQEVDD